MDHEQNNYILDEPAYPFRPVAILAGTSMAFMMACELIENGLDGQTLLAFAVSIPLMLGALWLLCRLARKYRFRVDEAGVRIDALFGKGVMLLWTDVRTAAVVQYDGSTQIILSVGEPAEVLVKKRLMRRNGNTPEELHLGASDRMRRLVEHYLRMELPTFRL